MDILGMATGGFLCSSGYNVDYIITWGFVSPVSATAIKLCGLSSFGSSLCLT